MSANAFVDTNVQAQTTYNYYAVAVDGAGNLYVADAFQVIAKVNELLAK